MISPATGGGIVGSISETLSERVHELLAQGREPILSTTGTRAALDSLLARTEALEAAVTELAEALQNVAPTKPMPVGAKPRPVK
jgi:outer membrane protein TolC